MQADICVLPFIHAKMSKNHFLSRTVTSFATPLDITWFSLRVTSTTTIDYITLLRLHFYVLIIKWHRHSTVYDEQAGMH